MYPEIPLESLTMEQGRIQLSATDPGVPPAAEGSPPAEPSSTCGRFPVLAICEKAHRDQTGRALCLTSPDFPAEAIQHHLEIEECPVCRRWYDNASQEYARLVPVVRLAQLVKIGAHRADEACHEVPVKRGASGLDAVPLVLKWHADKDDCPQRPAWWVQVKAHADPSIQGRLKKLSGRFVQLTIEPADGGGAPTSVETRLGCDEDGNLVSIEQCLPIDPHRSLNVTLRLRPRTRTKASDEA